MTQQNSSFQQNLPSSFEMALGGDNFDLNDFIFISGDRDPQQEGGRSGESGPTAFRFSGSRSGERNGSSLPTSSGEQFLPSENLNRFNPFTPVSMPSWQPSPTYGPPLTPVPSQQLAPQRFNIHQPLTGTPSTLSTPISLNTPTSSVSNTPSIPVFSQKDTDQSEDLSAHDEELIQAQKQIHYQLRSSKCSCKASFTQPLHIEQIADYNVRPSPKVEFSQSFSDQVTVNVILYCGEMSISNGFTKGYTEVIPSGETSVSFKGLHFSKMMPIKKQIKGIKKPIFKILFHIPELEISWFSNPFRIVSNHCQQTEKIYKAALTKGEKTPTIVTSAPQKRRAAEVDPQHKSASTDDYIDYLFNRYLGSVRFDTSQMLSIRNWINEFFGKTINDTQRYNVFLKCFGPEEMAIEQVYSVYKHKYFFSFIEKSEAENLLRGMPGYFLFRFSTSQLHEGAFAFQVNRGNLEQDALENYRINYHTEKMAFTFLKNDYHSIEEFVQAFSSVLLYPLDNTQRKKDPSAAYKDQGVLLEDAFANLNVNSPQSDGPIKMEME